MIISKFLHSCILLEENGKRLLLDPGTFSFVEQRLTPEQIPTPDAVLITHRHPDHCSLDALRVITQQGKVPLYAEPTCIAEAQKAGLVNLHAVDEGQSLTIAGFTVETLHGEHGDIPTEKPHNIGYRINGRVVHPGDSLTTTIETAEALLLPVAAPWLRNVDALNFAVALKPQLVIPIHDGFVKEFFLERIYTMMCGPYLAKHNIVFHALGLGESVEV